MQEDNEHSTPGALKAPLFGSLVEQFGNEKRWVILDLGTAQSEVIGLLSKYRCSLDVADLPPSIETLAQVDEPELLQALSNKLIPRREDELADVVLCWDLLNYLEPEALKALMATVATRARPGALVHMLIAFSSIHMPARPCRYGVNDENHLVQYLVTRDESHSPQYTPKHLEKYMPGFELERAMLLRNGMQEYLYRVRRPGEQAKSTPPEPALDTAGLDLVDPRRFV